jgi:TM2 domain-containing membrane protein YozV
VYAISREGQIEKVLWSLALPGFGQILNGKFLKGFIYTKEIYIQINGYTVNMLDSLIVRLYRQMDKKAREKKKINNISKFSDSE